MAYKYTQIEEYIKSQILSGNLKKGDKIESEAELTEHFNLSRQTIRTAISNLIKEGLLVTHQGKGTFISDGNTSSNRSYLIGFGTSTFNSYDIFPQIVTGINSKIKDKGYHLIISENNNTIAGEYSCLKDFLDKGVDALIMEPCKSYLPTPNLEIYREFENRNIPILFFNGYRLDTDYSYINADDELGGYLATKHLLELGHREICGFFKFDDKQGIYRYKGFIKAYRDFGLPIPEKNIYWFSTEDYINFWENDNEWSRFLNNRIISFLNRCTALVSYNDYVTVRILELLKNEDVHSIDDFSIVSFDDTKLTAFSPNPITSITHPSADMGNELGETVLKLIDNPSSRIQKTLPVNIIVRESSKRIN